MSYIHVCVCVCVCVCPSVRPCIRLRAYVCVEAGRERIIVKYFIVHNVTVINIKDLVF
jgi:hypothetical protein